MISRWSLFLISCLLIFVTPFTHATTEPGSIIQGTVWVDANNNGTADFSPTLHKVTGALLVAAEDSYFAEGTVFADSSGPDEIFGTDDDPARVVTTTNNAGYFIFPDLPEGFYKVGVEGVDEYPGEKITHLGLDSYPASTRITQPGQDFRLSIRLTNYEGAPTRESLLPPPPEPEIVEEVIEEPEIELIPTFFYPHEDIEIFGKLNISWQAYANQCYLTPAKTRHYRVCESWTEGDKLGSFEEFKDDVVCEGFVEGRGENDYPYEQTISRADLVTIAVNMIRKPLVEPVEFQGLYTDLLDPDTPAPEGLLAIAETALKYDIISSERTTFGADKDVSRAEAYAMMMKSVCMPIEQGLYVDWQHNLYVSAEKHGLTSKEWELFEPTSPILHQEAYVIASNAANWAERTGGCNPKPEMCFLGVPREEESSTEENS